MIDGLSGAEIMGALFDLEPERPRAARVRPERGATASPSEMEMLARGLMGLPRYPLRLLRSLPRALPNLDETPVLATLPGRQRDRQGRPTASRGWSAPARAGCSAHTHYKAPKTSFNGRISPHRRFAFGQLDLEEVKEVKNEHGCTVNDVVVSICAGAVRRWLLEHDELPTGPARRPDPRLGPHRRADGDLRQPDHADERAAVHQRARPGPSG